MKRFFLLFTIALPVVLCQNLLAQSSRLTAEAHWTNNGASFSPTDSAAYVYMSSVRGGDLTHTLKYDTKTIWNYMDTAYANSWNYVQTFDSSNNITSMTSQVWDTAMAMWMNSAKTLNTYTTDNMISTVIKQSWDGSAWAPLTKDIYNYNSFGKVSSSVHQVWILTSFVNNSQKTYYYDTAASHNLTNETDVDLSTGSPIYTVQYAYTYSSDNKVLTATQSDYVGAMWVYDNMTTNTYDGSGNKTKIQYQIWNSSTTSWVNVSLHLNVYSTGMTVPSTEVNQTWTSAGSGAWVNVMQFTDTYNSNGQLTNQTGESWNVVGVYEYALGDPMSNYYYGPYSSTSVANVYNNNGNANVYPVPCSNTLHIDVKWNVAQATNIAIYDVQGKVVRQWDAPAAAQYNCGISVGDFAAGLYIIKINGAQGQIVKQIVVAH